MVVIASSGNAPRPAAATATFTPVAYAYVDSLSPSTNRDTSSRLGVDNSPGVTYNNQPAMDGTVAYALETSDGTNNIWSRRLRQAAPTGAWRELTRIGRRLGTVLQS